MALVQDVVIPVETEAFQGAQMVTGHSGNDPRPVEILDADPPMPTSSARIEEARQGGDE
jgi:hypothetical protein